MKIKPEIYLKSIIKDYYTKNKVNIKDVDKREFGCGVYGKKISSRHRYFENNAKLNQFLETEVPFFISYSAAYYRKPGARPMSAKEYQGGDLVFEFDADDIPTKCKKIHDSWLCPKCGEKGKGHSTKCPNCGAHTKLSEWICDNCINATKSQTKKLHYVLTNEFNIPKEDIIVMFSGHKGFHIKIKNKEIYGLNKQQRLEFMNYISEDGLNFKSIGFVPDNRGSIKYIGENFGKGWKYLDYIVKAIQTYSLDELIILFDSSKRTINKLFKNKEKIINTIKQGEFHKLKEDSASLWYNALTNLKEKQRIFIDKQTTVDVHKIIRCENTIHGGALLISKIIDIDNIDKFNPFSDAIVDKKANLKIHLKEVPRLILNGAIYGPYLDEIVELPYEIAIYFLAKGASDEVILSDY